MRIVSKAAFLSLAILILCIFAALISEFIFDMFTPHGRGWGRMFGMRWVFFLFCVGLFVLLAPISEFFNKIYSKARIIVFVFAILYIILGLFICLYARHSYSYPYYQGNYIALYFCLMLLLVVPIANLSTYLFGDLFIRVDSVYYAMAEKEISDNNIDKGVWAQAFVKANGNEEQRKAVYVKMRAKELKKKGKNS